MKHLLNLPRHYVVLALVTLLLGTFAAARWWHGGQDWSRFAVMGEQFVDQSKLPNPHWLVIKGSGYDGQYFFRFALDPFATGETAHGITTNFAAYRHQRILYPLTAHLLAFGNSDAIPGTMVLVNFIALVLVAFGIGKLALISGQPPHLSLVAALSPGLLMAFGRDLGEALSGACLVLGALALNRGKNVIFALAMTAAIATREAALLTAFAAWILAVVELVRERNAKQTVRTLLFSVPLAAFAAWQYWLFKIWGVMGILNAPSNRGWPFVGFFRQLALNPYRERPAEMLVQMLYLGWHVFLGVMVLRLATQSRNILEFSAEGHMNRSDEAQRFAQNWLWLAWIIWTVFATSFSEMIWIDDWGFTRILSDWSLIGLILLMLFKPTQIRPFSVFGAWTVVLFTGTALRLIIKP